MTGVLYGTFNEKTFSGFQSNENRQTNRETFDPLPTQDRREPSVHDVQRKNVLINRLVSSLDGGVTNEPGGLIEKEGVTPVTTGN